jgi:hypothetical protein
MLIKTDIKLEGNFYKDIGHHANIIKDAIKNNSFPGCRCMSPWCIVMSVEYFKQFIQTFEKYNRSYNLFVAYPLSTRSKPTSYIERVKYLCNELNLIFDSTDEQSLDKYIKMRNSVIHEEFLVPEHHETIVTDGLPDVTKLGIPQSMEKMNASYKDCEEFIRNLVSNIREKLCIRIESLNVNTDLLTLCELKRPFEIGKGGSVSSKVV